MAKHREKEARSVEQSGQPPTRFGVEALFSNFEKVKRNEQAAQREINKILKFTFLAHQDVRSIVEVVLYILQQEVQEQGEKVSDAVPDKAKKPKQQFFPWAMAWQQTKDFSERYFNQTFATVKYLSDMPVDDQWDEFLADLDQKLLLIQQVVSIERDPRSTQSSGFADFTETVRDGIEKSIAKNARLNLVIIQSQISQLLPRSVTGESMETRFRILDAITVAMDSEYVVDVPEKNITALQNIPVLDPDKMSDQHFQSFYDFSYGGVSLREICALPEGAQEEFGMKLLRWLTELPKGDAFIDRMKSSFFLPFQFPREDLEVVQPLLQQEITRKISLFQKWMGEKILLPIFNSKKADEAFDQLLFEVIDMSGGFFSRTMVQSFLAVMCKGVLFHELLFPNTDPEGIYKAVPLLAHAERLVPKEDLQFFIPAEVLSHIFTVKEKEVMDRMRKILGRPRAGLGAKIFLDDLTERIQELKSRLPKVERKEHISPLQVLREKLGPHFWEQLEGHHQEFAEVSQRMLSEIRDAQYWPHEGVRHVYTLTEKDDEILRTLFSSIEFLTEPYTGSDDQFVFFKLIGHSDFFIEGAFDLAKSEFTTEATSEDEVAAEHFFQFLATAVFKTFVTRQQLPEKQRKIRGVIYEATEKADDKVELTQKPIYLPRVTRNPAPGSSLRDAADEILKEKKKNETKTGEQKRRKTVAIGMEKRSFPRERIAEYFDAIDIYDKLLAQDPKSKNYELDLEAATEILEEYKKRMHKPSFGKLQGIPLSFQLKWVRDPVTGETVYLETWVTSFFIPKLTAEEKDSFVKFYENRGQDILSTDLLNVMKMWVVGGDMDDFKKPKEEVS